MIYEAEGRGRAVSNPDHQKVQELIHWISHTNIRLPERYYLYKNIAPSTVSTYERKAVKQTKLRILKKIDELWPVLKIDEPHQPSNNGMSK
jgi:hypothetical protein